MNARISTEKLDSKSYISTENMLQNNSGITEAFSIPIKSSVTAYHFGDVLISNIRPYLKKTWLATYSGGCSSDVLVVRSKTCLPKFLFYILSSDKFVKHVMNGAKGVKMPRGDKKQIMKYEFHIPYMTEQYKITDLLSLIDERIEIQNGIINDLKKLRSEITNIIFSSKNGRLFNYGELFNVCNGRNVENKSENVLSATQDRGMVKRSQIGADIKYNKESINNYKIVKSGDYIVHLRSFQGGFAFSSLNGICSPAYCILRPNEFLIYGYLSDYFKSDKFINSLKLVTYGIRDGRSINIKEFLKMGICIPPKQSQNKIKIYLDSIVRAISLEEDIAVNMKKLKYYLLSSLFI